MQSPSISPDKQRCVYIFHAMTDMSVRSAKLSLPWALGRKTRFIWVYLRLSGMQNFIGFVEKRRSAFFRSNYFLQHMSEDLRVVRCHLML